VRIDSDLHIRVSSSGPHELVRGILYPQRTTTADGCLEGSVAPAPVRSYAPTPLPNSIVNLFKVRVGGAERSQKANQRSQVAYRPERAESRRLGVLGDALNVPHVARTKRIRRPRVFPEPVASGGRSAPFCESLSDKGRSTRPFHNLTISKHSV
jgi:hypothetical protein